MTKTFIIFAFLISASSYGGVSNQDDRIQFSEWEAGVFRSIKTAVATQVNSTLLKSKETDIEILDYPLGKLRGLCPGEKYSDQPIMGECSAFLVGDSQTLVTAGHCHDFKTKGCDGVAWVFNYQNQDLSKVAKLNRNQIYKCKKIIDYKKDGLADYAVIQLDRSVIGATPFQPSSSDLVKKEDPLLLAGYPLGLNLALIFGGKVKNISEGHIKAEIDVFSKNSGSPVVNLRTGKVEGIATNSSKSLMLNSTDGCWHIPYSSEPTQAIVNRISNVTYMGKKFNLKVPRKKGFELINSCSFSTDVFVKYRDTENKWVTLEEKLPQGEKLRISSQVKNYYLHSRQSDDEKALVKGKDFYGFVSSYGQEELGFKSIEALEFQLCP